LQAERRRNGYPKRNGYGHKTTKREEEKIISIGKEKRAEFIREERLIKGRFIYQRFERVYNRGSNVSAREFTIFYISSQLSRQRTKNTFIDDAPAQPRRAGSIQSRLAQQQ
jgi:hypothetical protein